MIFDTVNHLLESYQLRVHSLPLFERQEFWNIVKKYEGRIQGLEFEFITPNMANISGTLPSDLRDFAKSTNSTTNRLEVKSDADTALHVSEDNPAIQGLVDYSAEGGGNIAVKVSGLKKRKHTARTVREVELEDVEIQAPAEEVINILKQLMG